MVWAPTLSRHWRGSWTCESLRRVQGLASWIPIRYLCRFSWQRRSIWTNELWSAEQRVQLCYFWIDEMVSQHSVGYIILNEFRCVGVCKYNSVDFIRIIHICWLFPGSWCIIWLRGEISSPPLLPSLSQSTALMMERHICTSERTFLLLACFKDPPS